MEEAMADGHAHRKRIWITYERCCLFTFSSLPLGFAAFLLIKGPRSIDSPAGHYAVMAFLALFGTALILPGLFASAESAAGIANAFLGVHLIAIPIMILAVPLHKAWRRLEQKAGRAEATPPRQISEWISPSSLASVIPRDAFIAIANQARWVGPDAVYLVFARDGIVAGVRVGGQLWPEGVGGYATDPRAYADRALLRVAADADPLSPDFVESYSKSFRFTSAELRDVRVSNRRAWDTGVIPNCGVVTLVPHRARRMRLILLGKQSLADLRRTLTNAGLPLRSLASRASSP
jgi:hypothetical protein